MYKFLLSISSLQNLTERRLKMTRKEAIGTVFYDVNGCSLSVCLSFPEWEVQYNDWWCTVVARSVRWKDNVNKWASPWVHLLNLYVYHWLLQRKQPELIMGFNLRWLPAYRGGAAPIVGFPPCFLLWSSKKVKTCIKSTRKSNQMKVYSQTLQYFIGLHYLHQFSSTMTPP